MYFVKSNRYEKAYRRLSSDDKRRVDEALKQFEADPLHPSLAVERVVNQSSIWSFRVSGRLRCTFEWDGSRDDLKKAELIVLRNVGGHEVYR